ncbi:unnamed protein product [Mesocestoides corti]|uniref:RGS domain-containing protein n=2 Tax=Mesocestoides corti TaxID=53468 RepID=A0A0R3U2L3_MESCO|nr:unnamed protein product [Mesocestoides corti]
MISAELLQMVSTNVRGRISNFWRQAATAALRHQKQTELALEAANQQSSSSSPSPHLFNSEEVAARRTLATIFGRSWPKVQQVTCWQHSFKDLLEDKRKHKMLCYQEISRDVANSHIEQFASVVDGLLVFREFLRGEFSDENLEFWIACKEYKALTDECDQRTRAQEIYEDFIAYQSQREVNLDCETRMQTERRLPRAESDLFDASQKRIEALMEKDPYRRFLRSTIFLKLLEICEKEAASVQEDEPNPNSRSSTFSQNAESGIIYQNASSQSKRQPSRTSRSVDLGDLRIVVEKVTNS